jgi:hypothetical protein
LCLNNCQLYEAFPLNLLENINGFVDVFSFTFSVNFEGIEIKNKCWLSINFCNADMHTKSVGNNNMYLTLVLDYLNDVMACSSFFFPLLCWCWISYMTGWESGKWSCRDHSSFHLFWYLFSCSFPLSICIILYYYFFFWMGGVSVYMAETQSKIMPFFYPVTD